MYPGVRTFLTGYSPDGKIVEFGKNAMRRIKRLCHHADVLEGKIADAPGRRRASLRRAALRMNRRMRNLVEDMHRKIVAYLNGNYRLVLLPEFKASEMVRRGERAIRSRTVRQMLTLRHFSFRQRLLQRANASDHSMRVLVRNFCHSSLVHHRRWRSLRSTARAKRARSVANGTHILGHPRFSPVPLARFQVIATPAPPGTFSSATSTLLRFN